MPVFIIPRVDRTFRSRVLSSGLAAGRVSCTLTVQALRSMFDSAYGSLGLVRRERRHGRQEARYKRSCAGVEGRLATSGNRCLASSIRWRRPARFRSSPARARCSMRISSASSSRTCCEASVTARQQVLTPHASTFPSSSASSGSLTAPACVSDRPHGRALASTSTGSDAGELRPAVKRQPYSVRSGFSTEDARDKGANLIRSPVRVTDPHIGWGVYPEPIDQKLGGKKL